MATVRIPDEGRDAERPGSGAELPGGGRHRVRALGAAGAESRRARRAEDILAAYADEIERLKARGGYVTADVIDVTAQTPDLDAMLAKFRREHWHDEDEVRFIVRGHGLFHIHPRDGRVFALEVVPGDLIRVPGGTWHWFDLCSDRNVRAIRLFQDPSGWTPRYTESGVDARFEPVCFGPAYLPADPR